MRVTFDNEKGVANLSPMTSAEEALLDRISNELGKGRQLKYAGRDGADHGTPYSRRMELSFWLGSDKVKIAASTDEDEPFVRRIRDAIYFGGSGLYVVDSQSDATVGKRSLNVCVKFCQHCNTPLIERGRVEWRTCEACVAKCEHRYISGEMHGGSAGQLADGLFCDKCGRGKPGDVPTVIVPHHPDPNESQLSA